MDIQLNGVLKDAAGVSYDFNGTIKSAAVVAPPPVVVEPPPVVVEPPPPAPAPYSAIPLSWDAARFALNVSAGQTTVQGGSTLLNKSIAVHGEPASLIVNGGVSTAPTTVKNTRVGVASREAVRISSGHLLFDGCYLEAKGSGDDHADTIQAYAGGAAKFYLTVKNSLIKAYNTAATAGLFVSDNCTGGVTLENVVFQGGPYGLRLHADVGGNINISMKDVYFVGPFGYDPFFFLNYGGGKCLINLWENVREATIVNGALVPGALIPKPF